MRHVAGAPASGFGSPGDGGRLIRASGALRAGMEASSGLQTDCEALLGRFQEMDSVRFEDFTELWRKMKFGTIFW